MLSSADAIQGYGIGEYPCSTHDEEEYLRTLERVWDDERIEAILFSHAYEPWNCDCVFGREGISAHEELTKFVSTISKTTKAILFNDIRVDNLDILEDLHELECVIISYCPKLNGFWDFERTPRLKVLKYKGNRHFIDITQIEKAINLEYFEIDVLISQSNLNFIQSFEPLTKLKKLKEVVLRGVMCLDNNIDSLINISNLEKLWISPNTFSLDDFAKFESQKFKIFEEYGIFQNGDFSCPLGKGGRVFRSEKSKEEFKQKYYDIMSIYKKQ